MCDDDDDDIIFIEAVASHGDPSSDLRQSEFDSYERLQNAEQAITAARCISSESSSNLANVELQGHNRCTSRKLKRKSTKKARCGTQLLQQCEKRKKAIEREISASMKSKCEKYVYCCVSRQVFDEFPEAESVVREVFAERNISDQLVCDENRTNTNIFWYRKCIEAIEEKDSVVQQHTFAIVLSDKSFKELVQSKSLEDFVSIQKLSYPVANSLLILIIYGKRINKIHDLSIELFDNYRVQYHYVESALDFALYLAQISRALAKLQRHCAFGNDRLIFNVDKGMKDGTPEQLIRDWWEKMLAVICGIQGVQKRAIMSAYPNPFIASKKFLEKSARALMQVKLHARNTFSFLVVVAFIYLGYVIFLKSGDGFPEIDVDLSDVVSYAVLAVEMGGYAVRKIHEGNALHIAQKGLTDEGKAELLTKADLVSNFLILDVLKRFPGLKIITEEKESYISESDVTPYRKDSYSTWMSVHNILAQIPSRRLTLSEVQVYVDPLDATQEYTEGLTEYVTVMTCVVVKDEPVFGVIFRPFSNETVVGVKDWGVVTSFGEKVDLVDLEDTAKKIVVSRSHAGAVEEMARRIFGNSYEIEPAGGSGYKTLRLLNGTAELYIHQTAIKKWDTCAGDAILRSLGGAMLDFDGMLLKYGPTAPVVNKRGLIASVRNPYMYSKKILLN
ncbi:inositol monophosphatase family protein [Dictyocaulus viviparus]|uniref:inositol-phosphate phosphatase n=1 Tax=Dictyocaulus viviparus TaxID=29172 RepID=A0A0D8XPZ3_DICVI|nr:inositol monophosphatase family protein [Dictyocaulus viviparus]